MPLNPLLPPPLPPLPRPLLPRCKFAARRFLTSPACVVVNAGLFTHPKGASTANYSRTHGLEDESCMRAGDCMPMTSDGLGWPWMALGLHSGYSLMALGLHSGYSLMALGLHSGYSLMALGLCTDGPLIAL